jgi:hypothetical protein
MIVRYNYREIAIYVHICIYLSHRLIFELSTAFARANTMPEIAEVERARTILEQILKDQTIIDVEAVLHSSLSQLMAKFDDAIVFKDTTAKDFTASVKGKKVVGAKRWGKYFWFGQPFEDILTVGYKWSPLRIPCCISVTYHSPPFLKVGPLRM